MADGQGDGQADAPEEQVRRLRARVRRLRRRLGDTDALGDLGYLVVVTYGRSGSTLLQGVLNSLPGYLVRGENRAALRHLHGFHRAMTEERPGGPPRAFRDPTHPWFGVGDFPADRSLAALRGLAIDTVLRPEPDTRVVGFKEVRWYHDDLPAYVAFLRELLPGVRFVVNTRDHAAVLDSMERAGWFGAAQRAKNAALLAATEERFGALLADLGDAAYAVRFEEWSQGPAHLAGLHDWLGEPLDVDRVGAVLGRRHSV
ncbi:MAG: sulfotransferase family protein [Nocardioides sp.]|nr:sulfotransferase family protein [Nocardioides sp.]